MLKDKGLDVIYNGIDTDIFRPQDKQKCRQELGLPQDKKIVLIVAKGASSNPWKGGNYAQWAINALKADSRAFFVDLGGNTNRSENGLKTVGFTANNEVLAKYYSAADMLLYPSLADNCPLVILEAMACGLPIVTFHTGGIPELVEHKINGYIAGYKDSEELKKGLNYMIDLPDQEIEKMRQYSVAKIRSGFTVEKMTEKYLELYQKLLK